MHACDFFYLAGLVGSKFTIHEVTSIYFYVFLQNLFDRQTLRKGRKVLVFAILNG